MLHALFLTVTLALPQGGATATEAMSPINVPEAKVILARGGPDRGDPFENVRKKREQAAKEKKNAS